MLVLMTRAVMIAMNVAFDDQGGHDSHKCRFQGKYGHDSHVGFEANTVTITMSVSMTRAVTIAMNVGFEANTIIIVMSVLRAV